MRNRFESTIWLSRVVAVISVATTLLTGCGGGGGGGSDAGTSTASSSLGNNAPTLIANPDARAAVGVEYTVAPAAQDADGDTLAFSVQNRPAWAQFSSATGQLRGTPSVKDIGTYANIVITVSDGKAVSSLPQFTVTVAQSSPSGASGAKGVATLAWVAPRAVTDNLKGYRVHYGTDAGSLSEMIEVPNAGVLTFIVESLEAGKYFFAITAVNALGLESQYSNIIGKSIS